MQPFSALAQAVFCLFGTLFPLFAFSQTDTVPPQLVCKGFQEVSINCQLGATILVPGDLLENYSDNVTPAAQLETGLRLRCTGSGFPENQTQLYFGYYDLGVYSTIEVWARDQAGNTSVCAAKVHTDANDGVYCKSFLQTMVTFAGNNQGISGVEVDINATRCPEESELTQGLTLNGSWLTIGSIPSGFQAIVTARKNTNPLNGITMHDLFLISQHILGITPLTNPYQLIAADADQDGQITELDRLTLRRLMSGTITQLPNGRSWRFVPADYVFPDPLHPFPFPETITGVSTGESHFYFQGVKIGDVDFSADPGQ